VKSLEKRGFWLELEKVEIGGKILFSVPFSAEAYRNLSRGHFGIVFSHYY
jgi:hypothetical protein